VGRGGEPVAPGANLGPMIGTRATRAVRLAITLAGLVLLGWGLGVLVLHLCGGFFHARLDRPVNRWFHAHHVQPAGAVLRRVSYLGSAPVVLAVTLAAGAAGAAGRRSRAPLVDLALAYGGGTVIALAVKFAVARDQAGVPGGLGGIARLAFPSGHATLAAAVYGSGAVLIARRRTVAAALPVGLALVIGISRVYGGQHDATDVLAGWLLGGLWAVAVTRDPLGVAEPSPEEQALERVEVRSVVAEDGE
jgi:membrane-associated phospholipid phosphatase